MGLGSEVFMYFFSYLINILCCIRFWVCKFVVLIFSLVFDRVLVSESVTEEGIDLFDKEVFFIYLFIY